MGLGFRLLRSIGQHLLGVCKIRELPVINTLKLYNPNNRHSAKGHTNLESPP